MKKNSRRTSISLPSDGDLAAVVRASAAESASVQFVRQTVRSSDVTHHHSTRTLTNVDVDRRPTEFFVTSDSMPEFRPADTQVQAPLVDINSICSVSDLHRSQIGNEPTTSRFGLSLSVSAPSMSHSIVSGTTLKARSSNSVLYATFFDVGIVRILFSPSWLTDGYFWALEYLHQRLVDISDRILASALTTGVAPEHFLRVKSHSMPNIDSIDKCQVLNEEPTNELLERRSSMLKNESQRKQPTRSLTLPTKKGSRKAEQRFTSFYRKMR